MKKWRIFLSALLSFAIIATGITAQAVSGCPMSATLQPSAKDAASGKICKGCAMTGKLESKKGKCCDDVACAAKCFSSGVSVSTIPSAKAALPEFAADSVNFTTVDGRILPHLLQTQDRPPRHLS